jgi:formylglycine-generating enzyme required for sulfatase activity
LVFGKNLENERKCRTKVSDHVRSGNAFREIIYADIEPVSGAGTFRACQIQALFFFAFLSSSTGNALQQTQSERNRSKLPQWRIFMLKTFLQRAPCVLWKASSRVAAVTGLCICLGGCPSLPTEGVNTLGMAFVYVPAGSFPMGCGESDDSCMYEEKPRHLVTINQHFYLGKYEVTQAQWAAVMGTQPNMFKGDNLPMENISWNEAQEFIRRLNAMESTNKYRLPTEAEWEYAARAGTMTKFSFDASNAGQYAWFGDNSDNTTHPVGVKLPNPLGLHDMHGNVWEWVQDWYGDDWYARLLAASPLNPLRGTKSSLRGEKGHTVDPSGPPEGTFRVLRGGGWSNDLRYLRSAHRHGFPPDTRRGNVGFRVFMSVGNGLKEMGKTGDAVSPAAPPGAGNGQTTGAPSRNVPAKTSEAPRITIPDIQTPEIQMPEVQMPEIQTPEIQTPSIEVPPIRLRLPF